MLLSCDSWELNFSTELASTLESYGAVIVSEFKNKIELQLQKTQHIPTYDSSLTEDSFKHNLKHPYAFVGIRGLPKGSAY